MKNIIEVVPYVLMSGDGLRLLRVEPAGEDFFVLKAEYAIGTSYDILVGEEAEVRRAYWQVFVSLGASKGGSLLPEERASPTFPLNRLTPAQIREENSRREQQNG